MLTRTQQLEAQQSSLKTSARQENHINLFCVYCSQEKTLVSSHLLVAFENEAKMPLLVP